MLVSLGATAGLLNGEQPFRGSAAWRAPQMLDPLTSTAKRKEKKRKAKSCYIFSRNKQRGEPKNFTGKCGNGRKVGGVDREGFPNNRGEC